MPMLAERKRKEKWILMPKKPMWAADVDGVKFGQKIMEKMGWSAGKGLGAMEQGIQEPLRVSYKNDTKGMGYKLNDDECITQQSEFNDLLVQLSGSADSSKPGEILKSEIVSLEEKSKQSKCRVHYQKFTRGKDLSRYSENDLACIFGVSKKKTENNISEENAGKANKSKSDEDKSFGVQTIHGGSLTDYFKNKQAEIKLRRKKTFFSEFGNSEIPIQETDQIFSDEKMVSSEVEFKERNPKKRKCSLPLNDLHHNEVDAFYNVFECSDEVPVEIKSEKSNGYEFRKKKFKENYLPLNNNNLCEIQPDSVKTLKTSMVSDDVNLENGKGESIKGDNGNQIYEKTSCKKRKYSVEKSSVHDVENTNIEMEKKFVEQIRKLKKKEKSKVEADLNPEQAIQSNETDIDQINESCLNDINSIAEIKDVKSVKKKKKKDAKEKKIDSTLDAITSVDTKKLKEDNVECRDMEGVQLTKKKKGKRSKENKTAVFDEQNVGCNTDSVKVECSKEGKKETSLNEIKSENNKLNEEVQLKKKKKDKRSKESKSGVFDEQNSSCNFDSVEVECSKKDENETLSTEMKSEINEWNGEVQLKKKKKDKKSKESKRAIFKEKSPICNSDSVKAECSKKDEIETRLIEIKLEINESKGGKKKKKLKTNNLNIEPIDQKEDILNEIKPEVNESGIERKEKKKRKKEKLITLNNVSPVGKEKTHLSEIEPECSELHCVKKEKEKRKKEKKYNFSNESVEENKTEQKFILGNEGISDCEKTKSEEFGKKKKRKKEKEENLFGDCPSEAGKEKISNQEDSNSENLSKKEKKEKKGCENKEGKKVKNSDNLKEDESNKEKRQRKKNSNLDSATEMEPDGEGTSISELVEKKAKESKKVDDKRNEIVEGLKIASPKMESEKQKVEGSLKGKAQQDLNSNVIHTHKMTLFNKRNPPEVAFPAEMTNSRALKLFFGARIDEFKGSNLGNLEGYGKLSSRKRKEDLERPTTR